MRLAFTLRRQSLFATTTVVRGWSDAAFKGLRRFAHLAMAFAAVVTFENVSPAPFIADAEAARCGPGKLGVERTIKVSRRNGFYLGTGPTGGFGLRPGEVVLTFDDGPRPGITEPILNALAAECAKATFFALGRAARAHPGLLKRVAREGHTIASHTQSHPLLTKRNSDNVRAEVRRGITSLNVALKGSGHKASNFFRYPYLGHNDRTHAIVRSMGLVVFDMHIDSLDWKKTSADVMLNRVLNRIRQKGSGVVLFHDIQHRTAAAMPAFLRTLRKEGYKIVHIVPGKGRIVLNKGSYGTPKAGPTVKPQRVAASYPPHVESHRFILAGTDDGLLQVVAKRDENDAPLVVPVVASDVTTQPTDVALATNNTSSSPSDDGQEPQTARPVPSEADETPPVLVATAPPDTNPVIAPAVAPAIAKAAEKPVRKRLVPPIPSLKPNPPRRRATASTAGLRGTSRALVSDQSDERATQQAEGQGVASSSQLARTQSGYVLEPLKKPKKKRRFFRLPRIFSRDTDNK